MSPDVWIQSLRKHGYRVAFFPAGVRVDVDEYVRAAREADILIAEVGAWSNPLDPDPVRRSEAIRFCQTQLALAEQIGARCCVNISGSRNPEQWDGPHNDNFSRDTFDMIVDVVREIIDAVRPTRTWYTLEPMPWALPDSVESYVQVLEAVDRQAFAAHLDPVNLITNPRQYYAQSEWLLYCVRTLGPFIKSCHIKDIVLEGRLTVQLRETRPGLGKFDYRRFFRALSHLDSDMPVLLEHLDTEEEYGLATRYVRGEAAAVGITL